MGGFEEFVLRRGYVRRVIVVFTFPSEYRGSKARIEHGEGFLEVRRLRGDPKEFRRVRVKFYDRLRKIAWRSDIGWVLKSTADVSVLDDVVEEVRKLLKKYGMIDYVEPIRLVEVLLPRHFVIKELRRYIIEKKNDLERLKELYEDRVRAGKSVIKLTYSIKQLVKEVNDLLNEVRRLGGDVSEDEYIDYTDIISPHG